MEQDSTQLYGTGAFLAAAANMLQLEACDPASDIAAAPDFSAAPEAAATPTSAADGVAGGPGGADAAGPSSASGVPDGSVAVPGMVLLSLPREASNNQGFREL